MVEENKTDIKWFSDNIKHSYSTQYALEETDKRQGRCPHCNAKIGKCPRQPLYHCLKCNKLVTSQSFCKEQPKILNLYSYIFEQLPVLSEGEKLAISQIIPFVPIFHFNCIENKKINGHAFGIQTTQKNIFASLTKQLPRRDLDE
eukprot:526778_1